LALAKLAPLKPVSYKSIVFKSAFVPKESQLTINLDLYQNPSCEIICY